MLEVRALVKEFGGLRAVDDVSFTLRANTITGLIGPNGAGKTTLFNMIAGVHRPDSGTIAFLGRSIGGLAPHRIFDEGLVRTFQIPRPFAAMTVLENCMLVPQRQAGEKFWNNWVARRRVREQERAVRERAREVLDFLGLGRLSGEFARNLSGGQQKLLELARVLMSEPRLILLDEPGAGVNPALLETIVDRLRELHERGIDFLVIEHNMDLIMSLCDPILVMANGRLLLEGSPEQVRNDPRVLEAYLGGVPA
ncbi:MAG: ABC transporter ATP-binding protein [Lautropia sp.]|nr:MAG: ABC transporter ATP-binding protein [Pseudomonadota bacterium]MBC6960022.1 ABC transporter ATP-binding protein [Lautropia sp.]MCL4701931.1 ABC transporter ATP-binding protein [Burkholderiaceae bacterium]MCZ2412804.1 ABC transporter ATP-binding protein [Burkholderiales bacterium]MDL1907539.1 ABC transporter ATP-binding protein [Betaproteobacteria bacterium PRO1]